MKNTLLISIIISCTIFACKKNNEPLTAKDILTSHSWIVESATLDGDPYQQRPCNMDDFRTYMSNNTMTINSGATLCPGDTSQVRTYGYSISDDEKILTTDYSGSSSTEEIVSITTSKLVLRQMGTSTYVVVYKRK